MADIATVVVLTALVMAVSLSVVLGLFAIRDRLRKPFTGRRVVQWPAPPPPKVGGPLPFWGLCSNQGACMVWTDAPLLHRSGASCD
jgi:hypothetical protein